MADRNLYNHIDKIYTINKKNFNNLDNYTICFIVLVSLSLVILYFYIKLDINVDMKNWDIHKCNPKYLFFSGQLKKNPNMSSSETTNFNLIECSSRFGGHIKGLLHEDFKKNINKINKNLITFDNKTKQDRKDIKNEIKSLEIDLDKLNNEIKSTLTPEKSVIYVLLKNIHIYMDYFNKIIYSVKEFSKNYLNQLMLTYLFKAKTAPDNERAKYEKKMFTIKYLLDSKFGGSIFSK